MYTNRGNGIAGNDGGMAGDEGAACSVVGTSVGGGMQSTDAKRVSAFTQASCSVSRLM